MLLISLWKWVYTRLINDREVLSQLYIDEVDDINNALQCSGCNTVVPPEYAVCPGCEKQCTMEMVWVPDIYESGGDIAFDLEEPRRPLIFELDQPISLTPYQADAIEGGAKFCEQHGLIPTAEEVCPECHHDELLAENPELAEGEARIRAAALRGIA